jgi:hypothetical protein
MNGQFEPLAEIFVRSRHDAFQLFPVVRYEYEIIGIADIVSCLWISQMAL